jgi:tRNA (adenine57-N1/adenine58-N1)-methyltransferase
MKMLIDDLGKKVYFDGKNDLQTHAGVIKAKDIIKAKSGSRIKSHLGKEFVVIDADFVDRIKRIKRGPQIITLKDAGIISAYTGIGPDSKVLEAGSGSGALTCYLANLVRPDGKVYSYEIRKDFFELTKNNLKTLGLEKFVSLKNEDVCNAKEKAEVVVLDLPEPWKVIEKLKFEPGTRLACYLPTANQVIELLKCLEKHKFSEIRVIEMVEKEWQAKSEALRPTSEAIGHTAFLIFSRKY